jgi:hypothetical protein
LNKNIKTALKLKGIISPKWPPWFEINTSSVCVIRDTNTRFNQNVFTTDKKGLLKAFHTVHKEYLLIYFASHSRHTYFTIFTQQYEFHL